MTITRELIENFKHYLIEEEKSSATLEKYMRDVTVFFTWLAGIVSTRREGHSIDHAGGEQISVIAHEVTRGAFF